MSTSSASARVESVSSVGRWLPSSMFAMEPRVRPQSFASLVWESFASRRRRPTFFPTSS